MSSEISTGYINSQVAKFAALLNITTQTSTKSEIDLISARMNFVGASAEATRNSAKANSMGQYISGILGIAGGILSIGVGAVMLGSPFSEMSDLSGAENAAKNALASVNHEAGQGTGAVVDQVVDEERTASLFDELSLNEEAPPPDVETVELQTSLDTDATSTTGTAPADASGNSTTVDQDPEGSETDPNSTVSKTAQEKKLEKEQDLIKKKYTQYNSFLNALSQSSPNVTRAFGDIAQGNYGVQAAAQQAQGQILNGESETTSSLMGMNEGMLSSAQNNFSTIAGLSSEMMKYILALSQIR